MFNTIQRRLVRNAGFVVPLLVAFGFVACDDGVVTPEEQEARLGATTVGGRNLTGQDYYTGIFFGKGPVASAIPEIKDNYAISLAGFTAEELTSIEAQQAKLLANIAAFDSGFFKRFEAAIESGSQPAIESALQEAGVVTLSAYLQTEEGREALGIAQQPENLSQITAEINERGGVGQMSEDEVRDALRQIESSIQSGAGIPQHEFMLCLVLALVVLAAVALLLVIAIAVAVAIWLAVWLHTYFWVFSAKSAGMLSRLQIEQMIDSLARQYGSITHQTPVLSGS